MKFGAMNFPIKPVMDELDKIHRLGFDLFELTLDPPCAHYGQVELIRDELVSKLAEHSMELVCHMPTFVYTADLAPGIREASLNEMIQSLFLAAQLNSQKVVLHPSFLSGLGPFVIEDAMNLAHQSLDMLADKAEQLGIQICLENMYPAYRSYYDPKQFQELFNVYPNLKMTLDTGHACIDDAKGHRLFDLLDRFAGKIGHVHVSDNMGRSDDHLAIGKGILPLKTFADKLKASGYDSTITFEIFSQNTDDLIASRDTMAAWLV